MSEKKKSFPKEEKDIGDNFSPAIYNLENDEDDNLYTLPEEDDESISDSGLNPHDEEGTENSAEVEEEEEEDEEEKENNDEQEENKDVRHSGNIISLLFKILLTPVEGWKELKRRHYRPDMIAGRCFLPLIFLASVSDFFEKFYGSYITSSECLMQALVTIISFFFGYFTVILLGGIFLPKLSRGVLKKDDCKNFIMIAISSLALFYIIMNIFPMLDAVLVFLPIWTIYIIYKGVRFLRIPYEVESRTKIIFSFLIVGTPFLWATLLKIYFNI